jgi:HK97 family phage portal protein
MFDFLRRNEAAMPPEETKASATGRVKAVGGARVAWSPRDAVSLTRAGFLGNPVGYRAVKMVAEAAAALPLVFQTAASRFDSHPIKSLLARPNAGQGQVAFLENVFGQILLTGNAYLEGVGDGGLPVELHVLRSDRMSLVPGANGWPVAYDYTVNARKHRFELGAGPSPICHIRNFHPQDDYYGLSPMEAASTAVDVHNSASRWSKALLDNAARPSGAIVYSGADGQGSMSADQYDRLLHEMETMHQGARNAGRPMLLEGGLDWKPMGFSPSDMEFQKTKEAAAREIATAFGVPPMMLGIPGDATYANYQEANRAFYRLTVLPLAQKVCGAIGDWLADYGDEAVCILPDPDQIAALSTEREAAWRRIGEAEFLTDAEKRRLLGLPALELGDE